MSKNMFLIIIFVVNLLFGQISSFLIEENNIKYIGAFNVPPNSNSGGETFAWAGKGLAYNPQKNTLFMTGHDHHQLVAEISIPKITIFSDVNKLPYSKLVQPFTDITEGNISKIGAAGTDLGNANNNMKIGGLFVKDNNLYGSVYAYYENAERAKRSHFRSSLNLSQKGDFSGMHRAGIVNPGLVAGYMGSIPKEWQTLFGESSLTGNACLPIITRSSFGPSVFAFSPENFVKESNIPAVPLVYYPEKHATLGTYSNETKANPVFNMTTDISGVTFPEGTSTILFWGSTGLGVPEYGAGTADKNMAGKKVGNYDEYYVYDPAKPQSKGSHAWPYSYYIWAYNAHDLLKVKEGKKMPWDIVPYKHWKLDLPYSDEKNLSRIGGVAYDPKGNRIFISQMRIKKERPVIHVFKIVK